MGIFDLVVNTVEGAIQAPLNVAKTVAGVIVAPLDDGETMLDGVKGTKEGIGKIGKSD